MENDYPAPPDIALVFLGTNDKLAYNWSPATTTAYLTGIVNTLREANPQVNILIAQLLPVWGRHTDKAAAVVELNEAIEDLGELETDQSPVVIVDFDGFDPCSMGLADSVHTNNVGDAYLAAQWFVAIRSLYETGDMNFDGEVNLIDYALFSKRWLDTTCGLCGGADFTGDGNVGRIDFFELTEHWMTYP